MIKKYTYGQKLPYEYVLCVAYHCNKETMKKSLRYISKRRIDCKKKRGRNFFVKDYDASSEDATQLKTIRIGFNTKKLKRQR